VRSEEKRGIIAASHSLWPCRQKCPNAQPQAAGESTILPLVILRANDPLITFVSLLMLLPLPVRAASVRSPRRCSRSSGCRPGKGRPPGCSSCCPTVNTSHDLGPVGQYVWSPGMLHDLCTAPIHGPPVLTHALSAAPSHHRREKTDPNSLHVAPGHWEGIQNRRSPWCSRRRGCGGRGSCRCRRPPCG
jgi:hypothetical protein